MGSKTESLVMKAFDEAWNDPEWHKLQAERDEKIRAIENEYQKKWLKIRNEYWKKYGIGYRKAD